MTRKKKPNGYWTKERCAESAKPYSARKEWLKGDVSAYKAAQRNGWLEECCAHMSRAQKPRGYWTKERCAESAKSYSTRKQWKRAEASAHTVARKKGWLDECCAHMGLPASIAFTHKEYVDQLAEIRPEYKVIGEYVNARAKITHQCSEDHQWEASPSSMKSGYGCPHCSGHIPQDYDEWLAENRPDIKVVGEYVNTKIKITHECSEGHRWDVTPRDIKQGNGCPQCADSSSDANVVYCWKVIDGPDDLPQALEGYHLVKFGITSQDCNQDRIKVAASKNKMQHEILIYQHTNMREARKYEKWLHSFGQYVAMPDRIDGKTEFRLVSDSELRFIMDMLPSNEVLMPMREPGLPLSVRMTAEEVRQGFMA